MRDQISQGADVIKFTATGGVLSNIAGGLGQQLFDDEMKAIVDTAHLFGRKVAAHAHGADGIASALKAETLILLTAVPGLMKNFPDESTLIWQLSQSQLAAASEAAQGRMKKKVLGAEEALKGGVSRVIIADGRIQNPISNALEGNGTVIQ